MSVTITEGIIHCIGDAREWLPDLEYLQKKFPHDLVTRYFKTQLNNKENYLEEKFAEPAKILRNISTKVKENYSKKGYPSDEPKIRQELEQLAKTKIIKQFQDNDIFEAGQDLIEQDIGTFLDLHYVALPWNEVKYRDPEYNEGYFSCLGWKPISNELVVSGKDFLLNEYSGRVRETKHLIFDQYNKPKRKTPIYIVTSKHDGFELGKIDGYGPWRQYVFQGVPNTIWSRDCLTDLTKFVADLKDKK